MSRNASVLVSAAAACLLTLAACGGSQPPTDSAGAQEGTQTKSPSTRSATGTATGTQRSTTAQKVTITVREGEAGTYLVDGSGTTVYLYTKDEPGVSNCYDKCIEAWPAVLGQPTAGSGVEASKLGTIERKNGKTQVTYAGHPLYYYVKDKAPGQTTGQGVGGVWYLVSPDGSAIKPSSDTNSGGY